MNKKITKYKITKRSRKTLVIGLVLFLAIIVNSTLLNNFNQNTFNERNIDKIGQDNIKLETSDNGSPLFQGIESPLTINDTGYFYDFNQEISMSDQEELNLSYYLDDLNNWKISEIKIGIDDLQDTRNWVNNSGFQPVIVYRKNQSFQSDHYSYSSNADRLTTDNLIQETGALYIRAHFTNVSFHNSGTAATSDHLYIYNSSYYEYFEFTGSRDDFYSPWVSGDTLDVCYNSDNQNNNYFGYEIDYYEFVNASSDLGANLENWEFDFNPNTPWGANTMGSGIKHGVDAMFLGYHGDWADFESFVYWSGTYSEMNQDNIQIPRGNLVDAYISFDYLLEFGFNTNNIIMYLNINDKTVYSKGMLDIANSGKNIWHSTGKVPLYLWENQTNIFNTIPLNDQSINVTLGLKLLGTSTQYSGYEDVFGNIVWFDNISLGLTTFANSSQDGINLTVDTRSLTEMNEWGKSFLDLTKGWDTDPIILTVNTSSPELTFGLNTTLYGYHETLSSYNQLYDQGVSYEILENGTIYWELNHYLNMPSSYEDFEFKIEKPTNWEFLTVFDRFLQPRYFESGKFGDKYIIINKTNALFSGWYTLTATSPNYLNSLNTKIFKQNQWVQDANFSTGESTQITTLLNYTGEIPDDVGDINLTIYYPNGTVFYEESKSPINGNVTFSQITFGALNTSGGLYEYTLFWSNGTALGGLKSSFIVNHLSSIVLLKPDDAKLDLRTEGFVGDIIPVRIILKDFENNFTISNAIVSYNWSDGTRTFSDAGLGIYETTLFTEDLGSRGLYKILINSSKIGFITSNITLEINLGEETNIQVLDSDYNIELHANSTIRFKFSDYDGDGIDGALVNVSINNGSLYTIKNPGNGTYEIEFSTLFTDTIGIYQLSINFSAISYEPQYYIHQFQITKQSVNLSVTINSLEISENSGVETVFNEQLNISVRAISNIDGEYLTGGGITYKSVIGSYQKNLTIYPNFWYNTTIICSPENFSWGDHGFLLEFNHPNYKTATFGFNLFIDHIEIDVDPIGFEDTINAEVGQTINVQLQLLDPQTDDLIEDAIITYSWGYGIGTINQTIPGTYEVSVKLPEGLQGNFRFDVFITHNSSIYKSTQYSFILVIGEPVIGGNEIPGILLWIIIGVLVSIVSVLGVLSLRSYVILPRKRNKEAELLSKTQRFKDLKNIQAIVVIHKMSGIPIYSKSYSILEKHKKELFSGFIQAITTVGEEFSEEESDMQESKDSPIFYGTEKILELDFKYFYCLIADKEDVRAVFVLKEKSSERLKSQVSNLILALNLKISRELENWDGSLDIFEATIPSIIIEYFELYYKGSFRLSAKIDLLTLRKEKSFSKLEIRVLNVIQSAAKRNNNIVNLDNIIELVSEENKDLIIEAIEVLIERKMISPINP